MTTQRLTSIFLATGLLLLAGGCSNSTRKLPGYNGYYNSTTGFGVTASVPQINDTYVSTATDFRIQFNEGVDLTSISTGNFRLTEYLGNTAKDVTAKLQTPPIASNANTVLIFTLAPNQMLTTGASYRLSLMTGIKSVSGRSMAQMFDLLFSTGAGYADGYGQNSDPNNPPKVLSIQQDIFDFNGEQCLGYTVQFSEDLISPPLGRIQSSELFGLLPGQSSQLGFFATYYGRNDYWSTDVGCGCDYFNMTGQYRVKITDAIDTTQTRLDISNALNEKVFGIPFITACGF